MESPERPKRSKKIARPGTVTLQEGGAAGTSVKAAGAGTNKPNGLTMDCEVVEARRKKGKGERRARKRQKGTH